MEEWSCLDPRTLGGNDSHGGASDIASTHAADPQIVVVVCIHGGVKGGQDGGADRMDGFLGWQVAMAPLGPLGCGGSPTAYIDTVVVVQQSVAALR